MIITQTPFRMSFFGGGTDIESYFKDRHPAFKRRKRAFIRHRKVQIFADGGSHAHDFIDHIPVQIPDAVDEIQHPAIRNAMKMLDMHELRLTYDSDLPARSGLGTSSSFAVGMLNAFYALKGKYASKEKLAKDAIHLERILCDEAGGWQDQIAAAYGGLNKIVFNKDGYEVKPVIVSPERKKQLNVLLKNV